MKYGLKFLLFHSYFERWKLDIGKCNNRLWKFTENSLTLKTTDKIFLEYKILRTEIWNMSPEIFLKVEIWALIFLSLKFHRPFLIVTYPLDFSQLKINTFCQYHTNCKEEWIENYCEGEPGIGVPKERTTGLKISDL